ncbi:MAG: MarR family transcriptional regulator [Actinobacteria bacterium]|nr:MarR family transcriptional regulator [Actinomycetota bacterium]
MLTVNEVELANRLRPVLLSLARELRREVHSLGVTGGQVTLLSGIKTNPGLSQRELAERERISGAAASAHVDRLERAGLVRRTRSETDRRRIGLEVTPKGLRVLEQVRRRRTAWLAERLETLSPEQRDAIESALEPLAALL